MRILSSEFDDIVNMLRNFVRCNMYSIVDRLANATGKEVVQTTLYEALRIARSAEATGELCEGVKPYIAREDSIKVILEELDEDLVKGLELVRKIAIRALTFPSKT